MWHGSGSITPTKCLWIFAQPLTSLGAPAISHFPSCVELYVCSKFDVPCISRRLKMPIWIHCTFFFSSCKSWNEKQHWTTTSFAVQQNAERNVSMRSGIYWLKKCMYDCVYRRLEHYLLAKGFICVDINMFSGWLICLNSTDLNLIFYFNIDQRVKLIFHKISKQASTGLYEESIVLL